MCCISEMHRSSGLGLEEKDDLLAGHEARTARLMEATDESPQAGNFRPISESPTRQPLLHTQQTPETKGGTLDS